jgi:regulator of cell morphogenesis and NO signaling
MDLEKSRSANDESPNSPGEVNPALQSGSLPDWGKSSLSSLMAHIVDKHHAYCREQLERIERLLGMVVRTHGGVHPELRRIQLLFAKLGSDLKLHLLKEEQTLFPMIARMEEARDRNAALPRLTFGTIANPIRMMVLEHDVGNKELDEIRKLSSAYTVPPDASESYQALYQGLKEFDADMQQHVYLEDRQLFPRAVGLEQSNSASAGS